MAAGRDCLIICFPLLGTLVAIALAIVTILGSNAHTMGLKDLYFMRVDFSNISTSAITGLSSTETQIVNGLVQSAFQDLGISNFFDAGITGYCEGTESGTNLTITKCTSPYQPYWFDLEGILKNETKNGIDILLPANAQQYSNIVEAASKAMWVCYVAGIVVLGIEAVIGLFSFHSRLASCCTAVIAFLAFALLLSASGLATGMFVTYRKYFNDELGQYGILASLDSKAFILTWIATGASLWSTIWWIFSICCGSTRHSNNFSRDYEEKQPFMGYTPTAPPHSSQQYYSSPPERY